MGYYSGNSGNIQFGTANVDTSADTGWTDIQTKITNWTLSTTAQLLDTTTLGDYDKTSVYGTRTTTGTLKLLYYVPNGKTNSGNSYNSASWFIHVLGRSAEQTVESFEVTLRLYTDDKNMKGSLSLRDYIEFRANLTNVSYGSRVGELVSVDVSFEVNGPVIRNRL